MTKRMMTMLLMLPIILSACGPGAPPTLSPADVQGTAVSAAWTVVAATQQAMPTATPIPPTETASPTPPPTFTPFALGTLSTPSPTPMVNAAGTDNCLHPINMGEAGPKKRIRIENHSGGVVAWLSLNLRPNTFGQCGAMSWSGKPAYWKEIVEIPAGSWWAYAGLNLKGGKSADVSASFSLGVGGGDDITILAIWPDKMLVHYP